MDHKIPQGAFLHIAYREQFLHLCYKSVFPLLEKKNYYIGQDKIVLILDNFSTRLVGSPLSLGEQMDSFSASCGL